MTDADTTLLVSARNPGGASTEDILMRLRADLCLRLAAYARDPRREARTLLENNARIVQLLGDAIHLAEANTRLLAE